MTPKCYSTATKQGCCHHQRFTDVDNRTCRKKRTGRHMNEFVNGIPNANDAWNLVCKIFNKLQESGNAEHDRTGEDIKRIL